MSEHRYRHLHTSVERGVLILTLSPSHLEGDELAQQIVEETQAAVAEAAAVRVVIDLGHVESLTSANFRPFLALRKQLKASGGRLVLCNLSGSVLQSFEVTRLVSSAGSSSAFFESQADVDAAVASLVGAGPKK
jgi:anti-anti-sigma factor